MDLFFCWMDAKLNRDTFKSLDWASGLKMRTLKFPKIANYTTNPFFRNAFFNNFALIRSLKQTCFERTLKLKTQFVAPGFFAGFQHEFRQRKGNFRTTMNFCFILWVEQNYSYYEELISLF